MNIADGVDHQPGKSQRRGYLQAYCLGKLPGQISLYRRRKVCRETIAEYAHLLFDVNSKVREDYLLSKVEMPEQSGKIDVTLFICTATLKNY